MTPQEQERLKSILRTLTEQIYLLKRQMDSENNQELLRSYENGLLGVIDHLFED